MLSFFHLRGSVRLAILIPLLLAAVSPTGNAQVTNVTDTQATPIPGAGHDYLGVLSETVNPANGSLSLRIQVPIPKGRNLTLPFAFAYDTNGAIATYSGLSGPNPQPFFSYGWSYTFPTVNSQWALIKASQQNQYNPCRYNFGYMFNDPEGTRHALANMGFITQAYVDGCIANGYCNSLTASDAWTSGVINGSGTALTIQDAAGTTYTFPPSSGLASSVEDRNGNIVSYNNQGNNAVTVTDTAGRAVLSTNGFGATGNTVLVSGLPNPYKLSWATTATWDYTNVVGALYAYPPTNEGACILPPGSIPGSGSATQLSSITLPNGESYSFTYDPTYGLVNEIIYPTGGWVKYTWGWNSSSGAIGIQVQYGACGWRNGTPVITKRQVSFDGSTVAQEQDFTYATNWTTNTINGTGVMQWTTKTTSVKTYD
jgi:hypothetical protein